MRYNSYLSNRKSIRLRNYDYASAGAYFVTICCKNKECLFGKIAEGKMILNEYGEIAHNEWLNTAAIRQNIKLHEFIIMPNHVHAIIEIHASALRVPARNERLQSPSNTLGAIVRGYKSAVASKIHRCAPVWQRNYYEHIIRNEMDFAKIAEYIRNNPVSWNQDCFNGAKPQHANP